MKFKNEDSVNNDNKTEDDIEGEEQEIKFKNENSVHSLLFLAVSVYNLVGRNLNKAHHIVFLDKTKKYVNNAVVILTYPPPQKTLRLLKLVYFFKGCKVLLCNFHQEQAWECWLWKTANGCSDRKKDILPIIQRVIQNSQKNLKS